MKLGLLWNTGKKFLEIDIYLSRYYGVDSNKISAVEMVDRTGRKHLVS